MIPIDRRIDHIIVHHSATPRGRDVDAKEIRRWHLEEGYSDIGYHDIIRIDGTIEAGRDRNQSGAHCKGFNAHSIGICIVGHGHEGFEDCQFLALKGLLSFYCDRLPNAQIKTHRDFAKTLCPGMSTAELLARAQIAQKGD